MGCSFLREGQDLGGRITFRRTTRQSSHAHKNRMDVCSKCTREKLWFKKKLAKDYLGQGLLLCEQGTEVSSPTTFHKNIQKGVDWSHNYTHKQPLPLIQTRKSCFIYIKINMITYIRSLSLLIPNPTVSPSPPPSTIPLRVKYVSSQCRGIWGSRGGGKGQRANEISSVSRFLVGKDGGERGVGGGLKRRSSFTSPPPPPPPTPPTLTEFSSRRLVNGAPNYRCVLRRHTWPGDTISAELEPQRQ